LKRFRQKNIDKALPADYICCKTMLKRFRKIILLIFLVSIRSLNIFSQCSSAGAVSGGTITPSGSWQTVTHAAGTRYYYVFSASPCNSYTFTFCQGGASCGFSDSQLTITDNSTGTTTYAYNDDYCSYLSELVWTPTTQGTYRLLVTQYSCADPTASATLAYQTVTSNTANINYSLNGNATSPSPYNCTTLTSATSNQLGCAWDVNSTLDFTQNFSYDFTINLGSSNAGADGMSFTIQNDSRGLCACGVAGNQLGAGTISNSLIVEIDTYINTEDRDDFSGNDYIGCNGTLDLDHLDIWLNGNVNPDLDGDCNVAAAGERPCISWAVPLKNGSSYYDIENGLNHLLRISWATGSPGTLTAKILDASATTTYGTASYSFNPLTVFGTNAPYFGFTASTGGLSNQQTFCNPTTLLPVGFLKFDAFLQNGAVQLEWITASEKNNRYFLIERSADATNWFQIGKQFSKAPNGTSEQQLSYQFTDESPLAGMNYYRIRQVDYDGKYSFSGTRTIDLTPHSRPVVFPNPFSNSFNLNVLSPEGSSIGYKLYNNLGEIILEESYGPSDENYFAKKIEVNQGQGIYYLVLTIGNERYTYKLLCAK
jgi:hypothetical protein